MPEDGLNEPSDHGLSRRGLFTRAGQLAAAAGAAAGLSACENTTTPVAAIADTGGGKGLLGDPTAGGPVDAVGIPLARRDYPVTLPRLMAPAKAGKPERGGELRIYNYADYLNPAVLKEFGKREGVSVRVTTFQTLDEAFSKLSAGQQFDVIFSTPDQLSRLVGRKLVAPLNLDLVPNLRNVWPEIQSPSYDVGARYSVPYTVYTTGVGWRNDKLGSFDPRKLDPPWSAFWESHRFAGKVAVLDDYREVLGMALMRRGITNLNTEDPALLSRALADIEELNGIARVKVSISEYETLPSGRIWLHQAWSGDMINAVVSYLPKGVKPTVLSYWYQAEGGPVFNDIITVSAKATKPVLAHRFLNYMLDQKVAYTNFAGYVGYQPPITAIAPDVLFQRGLLPEQLRTVVVTRDDYANGNAYLTLTGPGDARWLKDWQQFRNG
jgi:spermidine/putrescine transport system substrate-binding protein